MSAKTGYMVGVAVVVVFLVLIAVWVVVFRISQTIPNRTLTPSEELQILGKAR